MASASGASSSSAPLHYFLQSPYLLKEMESSLRSPRRALASGGGVQRLQRLRRGDMDCSFLVDERQRPALSRDNDRALNASGANSFAAGVLAPSAPTQPLLLYWTDGAKRTLPFQLLKAVSLRRSALRHSVSLDGWATPDPIVSVLGGSSALNAKLLDDKCAMQSLLAGKAYVPSTLSFDQSEQGWEGIVARAFGQGEEEHKDSTPHECTPRCTSRTLILKPAAGHKQRGILVLPHCAASVGRAVAHVASTLRPGGERGGFDAWVVQSYVSRPLLVSGMDLGLLWERGRELEEGGDWKKMLLAPTVSEAAAPAKPKRVSAKRGSVATGAKGSMLNATAAAAAASVQNSPASSSPSSSAAAGAKSIRHVLSPSSPFLPSDTGSPLHALGLFKVHFRVYSMVVYSSAKEEWTTYVCALSKVYHSPEPLATLCTVQPPPSAGQEECKEQQQPLSVSIDPAAGQYLCARSASASASSPSFPPVDSLPSSAVTLSQALDNPSLSPGASVSKYLAMRVAHHILPSSDMVSMLSAMREVIVDTVRAAVDAGGMQPCGLFAHAPSSAAAAAASSDPASAPPRLAPGMASSYFQFLGYDFLWDTVSSKPILLEVNNNVGQGLMSQQVMSAQVEKVSGEVYGHSNAQYTALREYWRDHFRQPFVEGCMRLTVDRLHNDAPLQATSEPMRLMSSPPLEDENCWVLSDVYQRRPPARGAMSAAAASNNEGTHSARSCAD